MDPRKHENRTRIHGKHGVEIRIMSLSKDHSDSWVRISHGSNKFVMVLNNNDTEIPEDQLEDQGTDQKQKQSHKEKNLLPLHQESFLWKAGSGLILNQGNILSLSLSTKFRRK